MSSIIDYAKSFTASFDESPFSQVDSLVLSELTYSHFNVFVSARQRFLAPVIKLRELLSDEKIEAMISAIHSRENEKKLLLAIKDNPRFNGVGVARSVCEFDTNDDKQFSAITFILNKKSFYVAFRGTDSTLVGWKEDFNMSFMSAVPAQRLALKYLNESAKRFRGSIFVGGHSKGGNLAEYAAIMCDDKIQSRIVNIFSHDGPGFKKGLFDDIELSSITPKILKTVPQSSLIGMLLESQENYTIIKSNASGIMQHDPYSWEIEDNRFVTLSEITRGAKYFDSTISSWLSTLSDEKRETFVDLLFRIVEASGANTIYDMTDMKLKKLKDMLGELKNVDSETKRFALKTIKTLAALAIKYTPKLVIN